MSAVQERPQRAVFRKGSAITYNSTEMDRKTQTYGGYPKHYVIDENYALKVNATATSRALRRCCMPGSRHIRL